MIIRKTIELPGGVTVPEEDYLNYLAQIGGFSDYEDYLKTRAKAFEEDDGVDDEAVRDAKDKKIIVHVIRR